MKKLLAILLLAGVSSLSNVTIIEKKADEVVDWEFGWWGALKI